MPGLSEEQVRALRALFQTLTLPAAAAEAALGELRLAKQAHDEHHLSRALTGNRRRRAALRAQLDEVRRQIAATQAFLRMLARVEVPALQEAVHAAAEALARVDDVVVREGLPAAEPPPSYSGHRSTDREQLEVEIGYLCACYGIPERSLAEVFLIVAYSAELRPLRLKSLRSLRRGFTLPPPTDQDRHDTPIVLERSARLAQAVPLPRPRKKTKKPSA